MPHSSNWLSSAILSLKDCITSLDSRKKGHKIADNLSCFSARIVLTAHPTQFYSPAVVDILGKLKSMLARNDIDQIDLTLQQLGLTSLINAKKPTPIDEAKNIIHLLRDIYYEAVGEPYATIKRHVPNTFFSCPHIIQLGFWLDGDRDGNPFVTSKTICDVADELRMNLMKCYYQDMKRLAQKLTVRGIEAILVWQYQRQQKFRLTFSPFFQPPPSPGLDRSRVNMIVLRCFDSQWLT